MTKDILVRESTIEHIRPFYKSELIKLLVGMRRSGKSVLLRQIMCEIELDVDLDHIIYINFESLEFDNLTNAKRLDEYVKSRIFDDSKYYLFLDEVQIVENFERALNSLRATENISIFATGSNGKLLSTELSTLLSGRYVKFNVYPLSFTEALKLTKPSSDYIDEAFKDYMHWGGLPYRFFLEDDGSRRNYLSDVFDSIAARDVVERAGIRNLTLFYDLLRYILENVGNVFSLKKVTGYLASIGRKASPETIYDYIHAATMALIIKKVDRYNIAGKGIMANNAKYYATDLGIMQIKAARNKVNDGAYLENIVYNELIRRKYDVYVGYLESSEIDFVAIKEGMVEYYQVCYSIADEGTREREFGAFKYVKDNYPKFIISIDKEDFSRDGITHLNAVNWLISTPNHEHYE